MKSLPARVLRRIKHFCLLLLLIVTAYLTVGRLVMPLVYTQDASVESSLSALFGVPVTIDDIQGSWFRFSPSVAISGLRIGDPALPAAQHRIGNAELAFDTVASLLQRKLVIQSVAVAELSLTLEEAADGRWALAGLPAAGNADYRNVAWDFLLQTNELGINEGTVVLIRNNGQRVEISSLILGIQNRLSRHNAQLQLRINGQAEPAQAVVQLRGDPRSRYSVSAWLDSKQVAWLPLVQQWLPPAWHWQQLQGRVELWAQADDGGLQDLKLAFNDMVAQATAADVNAGTLALSSGSAVVSVVSDNRQDAAGRDWQLRAQDIGFDWQNRPWQIGKLELDLISSPTPVWRVRADALDSAMLTQLATSALPLPSAALRALQTLDAKGILRNVEIETAPDGSYPDGFRLRTNLQDVAVAAWQQAPSASGLQGYVEANAKGGFAEIDSHDFTLHLPNLFAQEWHYDRINTRVRWQASRDDVLVESTVIEVANEDLAGKVSFGLHNTRDSRGLWYNDFSLAIGMQRMNVAVAPLFLPTLPRLRGTMEWLRNSLKGGDLGESGFVLHNLGGAAAPRNASSVASWYRVESGNLKFLPNWPAVSGLRAGVVHRNNEVDVLAQSGLLAGIEVSQARARIRPDETGRQLLGVATWADTPAASGLDFLRNTPVHDEIGGFLDTWQAQGPLQVEAGVGLVLATDLPPLIQVKTVSSDALLDLRDYDLQLKNIVGEIHYDSRTGLSAQALQARLFDFPLKAEISTRAASTPEQVISISGSGKASVTALQQWSGQPVFVRELFSYMQGDFDYDATLTVEPVPRSDNKQTRLLIETDLLGLTMNLPRPLAKESAQPYPLQLQLGFTGENSALNFRYHDWLAGELQMDTQGIQRGQISVGDRNRNFNVRQSDNNAAGVLVSGDMESFDFMAWKDIANELNQAGGEGRAVADYLRLVDVNVGQLMLPGLSLDAINVVVQRPAAQWQISGRNELLSGNLIVPDDDALPWDVSLQYLRLPPRQEADSTATISPEDEIDILQEVNPTTLHAFDFHTEELKVGEAALGAVSFEYRPYALGATIKEFRLQSPDSSITDVNRTSGASFDWRYDAGQHHSSFTGLFAARDLAKVLPAWGHDANVVSREARFDSVLNWPGSPLHFSVRRASGTVNLDIDDGRFVDIDSGSTRLLGALNFDALVRRLQLDFSDIFAKGYSFDSIDGLLNFNNGVVALDPPLAIDGPSSDLSLRGEINLRDETIAADMQVQIPLGQNLSMVAGLLGAWPIAVSTYLASKIFQDQVEDFTTVVYRLEGPWAEPTTGFEPPPEAVEAAPAANP